MLRYLEAHGLVAAGVVPAPLALTTAAVLCRQVPVLATPYVGDCVWDCDYLSHEEVTAAREGVAQHFDALQQLRIAHGDVAWRNVVRRRRGDGDGDAYTYTVIDFGRARLCGFDAEGERALRDDSIAINRLLGRSSDG